VIIYPLVIVLAVLIGVTLFFGAPYLPSKRKDINLAFTKLYKLGKKDVVVDAGCGDGVVLRAAARCGARAVGYEINPLIGLLAKILCLRDRNISVRIRNSLSADWPPQTTVIYAFGVEYFMPRLEAKVLRHVHQHGKPIYVISYGFEIPGRTPKRKAGPYFLYEFEK
jgi:hypothetical protein